MKFRELQFWWRIIKTITLVAGVLLSFFAVIEFIRAFNTLYELNPYAGYGFLIITGIFITWLFFYVAAAIGSRPKVLEPPEIKDNSLASPRELRNYLQYLEKLLRRLQENNNLAQTEIREGLQKYINYIKENKNSSAGQELIDTIQKIESECIKPLILKLDSFAEREVQKCIRDIMLGVTLSPYRAVDLFVVIYRNAVMVVNVSKIYNSQPRVREQIAIGKDVLSIVAAVNFINFGSRFTEQLMSKVPYIGTIVDDIAQGVGAGLLTSAAGHAAIHRCRSYKGWDRKESMHMMANKIDLFFRDVYNIFRQDVLPSMRYRVASMEAWEKLSSGMASAFEKMVEIIKSFVREPAPAGGTPNGSDNSYRNESKPFRFVKAPFSYAGKGARHINKKVKHSSGKIKSKLNKTFKKSSGSG